MKRRVWVDTDPGVDDLVALFATLGEGNLELAGISTVGGNVAIEQVTANALQILEVAGRTDIPVYQGATGPFPVTAKHVHGADGLRGFARPPTIKPANGSAVEALAREVERGTPLLCLGPLTNLAQLIDEAPELAHNLEIVAMGGAFGSPGGNVRPWAEFNVYADVEAFAQVLASPAKVTLIPLDLTHQTLVDESNVAGLPGMGPAVYADFLADRRAALPLHDPNVPALVTRAQDYGVETGVVSVSLAEANLGQTSFEPRSGGKHRLARQVDASAFFRWLASTAT